MTLSGDAENYVRGGKEMGKTSEQIYIDYQAVRQKADRLEELANEIRSVTEQELSGFSSNRGMWSGDSGDAYRQKLTRLECNLYKRANELQKTANALRSAAERQYRLERAWAELVSH